MYKGQKAGRSGIFACLLYLRTMLEQAYDPTRFRQLGHELVDTLADYLQVALAGNTNVLPNPDPEAERSFWEADWAQHPTDAVPSFWKTVLSRSHHLHHPHYVGHQVSVPAFEPVITSLLTALLNNGMAVYEMGPVSSALEHIIMRALGKHMGMGEGCEGVMTSGGTLANLTGLLAARQQVAPDDVWTKGTDKQYCLFVSEQAHYCVDRAVRIMGWGEAGMVKVPVDAQFRMRTDLLPSMIDQAIAAGKVPIAIVGSACSTSTGSYDDLLAIANIAQAYSLWVHVDGAHGAAAACSPAYKSRVAGIELADSVTIDFHKMMMVPALATGLVFRQGKASYKTFSQQAQYLWAEQEEPEWFNLGKRTFECTKRMVSVQVYSLLRTYGFEIVGEYVDRAYALAEAFASHLDQQEDFELAIRPASNIVCFRYIAPEGVQSNQLNQAIRAAVLAQEAYYLVQTTLHETVYLRTTLMHPFTDMTHLKAMLAEIRKIAQQLLQLSV